MATATASPETNSQAPARQNPAAVFRRQNTAIATSLLKEWVGDGKAAEASGRIAAALSASAASARDPSDFYACAPQSVGTCIAVAALTDIMPGVGATSLAYVVPQRARKGEAPQLQYMLSHRGLNALARRCGQVMIPIPIGVRDELQTGTDGDVDVRSRDIDNPPLVYDELRGVILIVKEISSGVTLYRGWVPKVLIDQRRAVSRSKDSQYGPWQNWPIEMAMKTAMHYAISRGWCVIDDTSAAKAISIEAESDLKALPAPSGPQSVDDLSEAINGTPPETSNDSTEGNGEFALNRDDLGFREEEKPAEWFSRVSTLIDQVTDPADFGLISEAMKELHSGGHLTDNRRDKLLEQINARSEALSE